MVPSNLSHQLVLLPSQNDNNCSQCYKNSNKNKSQQLTDWLYVKLTVSRLAIETFTVLSSTEPQGPRAPSTKRMITFLESHLAATTTYHLWHMQSSVHVKSFHTFVCEIHLSLVLFPLMHQANSKRNSIVPCPIHIHSTLMSSYQWSWRGHFHKTPQAH